jgi:hypothetical protein
MIRTHAPARFDAIVDRWVAAEVAIGRPTFAAIVKELPGVYPECALASLRRLKANGQIAGRLLSDVECEVSQRPARVSPGMTDGLPLPHPLEYEWRFTASTAQYLLAMATQLCTRGGSVMLLGTPSVAAMAVRYPSDRPLVFVGEENSVTSSLHGMSNAAGSRVRVFTCGQAVYGGDADVVVLDPPWYFDFIRPMLAAAALGCRVGGYLILSLPSVGTRPSAAEDRVRTIRLADRLGLELVEERRRALAYSSPLFERNALAAVGLANVPIDWRRSDLVLLRKHQRVEIPAPPRSTHLSAWIEIVLNGTRVFTRRGSEIAPRAIASLDPIVPASVLPSVSRRDPRRRLASTWTAGNRLFSCSRADLLVAAAMAVGAEVRNAGSPRRARFIMQEREGISRLAGLLREIAATEADEAQAFEGGVSTWTHQEQLSFQYCLSGSATIASGKRT